MAMSGLSSLNSFDPTAMAQAIVNAERTPTINRLNQKQSKNLVQISALGSYKNSLSSIQSSIPSWTTETTLDDKIKSVQQFVSQYNTQHSSIQNLTSYNSSTKTAGPLLSESSVRRTNNTLRQEMNFSNLGIDIEKDGSLKVNDIQLKKTLEHASTSQELTEQFSDIHSSITQVLSKNSAYSIRLQTLNQANMSIEEEKIKINERLNQKEDAYYQQFTRLNQLMSSFQSTSQFLSQQFSSWSNSK